MADKSTLLFKIVVEENLLRKKFEAILDDSFDNQNYEVNGVQLHLRRYSDINLIFDRNKVQIGLPLDVKLIRPSGLFTAEAKGKLKLSLETSIDLLKNNEFTSKSKIKGFFWDEDPKFLIGSLDIPIESLVNMVLNHYESIITAKIDEALSNNINIENHLTNALIHTNELAKDFDWFGIKYRPSVYDIEFVDAFHHEGSLRIEGQSSLDIEVSDAYIESSQIPEMKIVTNIEQCDAVLKIGMDVHFKILDEIIQANMEDQDVGGKKIKIKNLNTYFEDNKLYTDIDIQEPIEALFKVSANLLFRPDAQMMELEDIAVNMKSNNILYKLSAPIINKIIENQIDKFFPLDIKSYLDIGIKTVIDVTSLKFDGKVVLDYQRAKIDNVVIFENKVSAILFVDNASVEAFIS